MKLDPIKGVVTFYGKSSWKRKRKDKGTFLSGCSARLFSPPVLLFLIILPLIFLPSFPLLPPLCKTQGCVWLWEREEVKVEIIATGA